jgi:WXXGXW repeat (2 copies)
MRSVHFVRSLLFALLLSGLVTLAAPVSSFGQFGVNVTIAPPMLPVYEQPVIPGNGYLWTPGYWAWSPDYNDYYWVPGTWVQPPEPGVLWTPGYWGWGGNAFMWNVGYWGPQIGFYGGVNYGFGYTGSGYEGGYWQNGAFFYNRSVNNVTNVTNITNVYNKTVVSNVTVNNVSYNGGKGGISRQPTSEERTAASGRHIPPTGEQTQHQQAASSNPALRASANHGKPPIAATSKPGALSGSGVVAAKAAAPYHAATPAAAKSTPARSASPAGGGTRPLVTAHAAPSPNSASRPAAAQARSAPPPVPAQAKNAPRPAAAQARSAPRPAATPARSAPRAAATQARSAPRPAATQARSAPRPAATQTRSAPRPAAGEKPKEEARPPR